MSLQICVCSPPLQIHYLHEHLQCVVGVESTNQVAETFEHLQISKVSVTPDLPRGLSVHMNTASIFGCPRQQFPPTVFRVRAEAHGGCTLESSIVIEVLQSESPSLAFGPERWPTLVEESALSESTDMGSALDSDFLRAAPEAFTNAASPRETMTLADSRLEPASLFASTLPTLTSTLNPDAAHEMSVHTLASTPLPLPQAVECADKDQSLRLAYKRQRNLVYTVDVAIASNAVATELPHSGVLFHVLPSLPDGLVLDRRTGSIAGIPTHAAGLQEYVVTAARQECSWKAVLQLEVQEVRLNPSFLQALDARRPGFASHDPSLIDRVAHGYRFLRISSTKQER